MTVINKSITALGEDRVSLSVFASDIPLAPGEWPTQICVTDDAMRGFVFTRTRSIPNGDDLGGFVYTSVPNGSYTLTVFND